MSTSISRPAWEDTLISGAFSFIEAWPEPIYVTENKNECPVCREDPLTRPVQIQCGHVICNPCMQSVMATHDDEPLCFYCRSKIYEYRSLCSGRIRRPRDKSVPLPIHDDSRDTDYQPPSRASVNDVDPHESDSSTSESHQANNDAVNDPSENPVEHQQLSDHQQSTQDSVVILAEIRASQKESSQESVIIIKEVPARSSDDTIESHNQHQNQSAEDQIPSRDVPVATPRCNRQAVYYQPILTIESHRGRGRCIRYKVVYLDGDSSWEPISHMDYCTEELRIYRNRLHVISQTKYRARCKARQQER